MSDFPSVLKSMRLSRGLTQEALAEAIGVSKSTISMYERGNREPDFETLEQLAKVFDVSASALIANKNEPDAELWEIRETLRRRPEMRTLFSIGKKATAEELRQTIAIIEALRKSSDV